MLLLILLFSTVCMKPLETVMVNCGIVLDKPNITRNDLNYDFYKKPFSSNKNSSGISSKKRDGSETEFHHLSSNHRRQNRVDLQRELLPRKIIAPSLSPCSSTVFLLGNISHLRKEQIRFHSRPFA